MAINALRTLQSDNNTPASKRNRNKRRRLRAPAKSPEKLPDLTPITSLSYPYDESFEPSSPRFDIPPADIFSQTSASVTPRSDVKDDVRFERTDAVSSCSPALSEVMSASASRNCGKPGIYLCYFD